MDHVDLLKVQTMTKHHLGRIFSSLIADAMSMAVGEYVSVTSQATWRDKEWSNAGMKRWTSYLMSTLPEV
ncbi:hypothetical protein SPOG_01643 [Schizosaccharomyces cryophilus OY26]|uniref:Uncharacterized protein n=1 Tax=Schizosaccharomyces cryophilus (strain OY26 / ATCC MYA-4695 / CBS 11777 / NBRC 106824 / NRRL Y48691) TaxID=653667 RepID=S9XF24_SCHCR|nr:uncharacterized protein SPOG_01643 [Schizosaccharomyces cryophilus OY26]EPY52316.1 hypothetical protein SPOG_01643 [Schizosaccharomyces cryophilus OY26]